MSRRGALRGFPVFAAAIAGVLAAHSVAYLLSYSDPHARDSVLEASGHAYLPLAAHLAVILLLAAVGAVIVRHLDGSPVPRKAGDRGPWRGWAGLAGRLWVLQSATFVAVELAERLAAGAPLEGALADHLLLVGLAVQLVVAAIGATLLGLLDRAAAGLSAADRGLRSPHAPRIVGHARRVGPTLPARALAGAAGVRGPPLP